MKPDFDKIFAKVNLFHSYRQEALNRDIEKHKNVLHQILAINRWKKYERNKIDVRESNTGLLLNNSIEKGNFRKGNINSNIVTKEDLIKNV